MTADRRAEEQSEMLRRRGARVLHGPTIRTMPLGPEEGLRSASDTYSACLPMDDAARGVLAWELDGVALTPEQGGPLRFVAPPDHWGYKGVKWATRVTVLDHFVAGFWESRLEDPVGRIPESVELP